MSRSIPLVVVLLLASAPQAFPQTGDVRIDISSGQGRRIRVLCESMSAGGDRTARVSSVQADEVLAADLENSGVFLVTRSWTSGERPPDIQATVSGKWTMTGNQIRLRGEVRDVPARRAILVDEYRGSVSNWRSVVHQFADDIVLQFTGEPGIAQTQIAFVAQNGREKELYVMDYDGAGVRPLTRDRSIALSPNWSPDGSLLLFTSYRAGTGPKIYVLAVERTKPYVVSARPGNNTSAS